MRNSLLIVLFVAVFIGDVFACENPQPVRLACVGDSITTGWYPGLLRDMIVGTGRDVDLRVHARKGRRISSAMIEMYGVLNNPNWKPTHVVFYAGINDCLQAGGSNVKKHELVIEKTQNAIEDIEKSGAVTIIVKHHSWSEDKKSMECSAAVNKWLDGVEDPLMGPVVVDTHMLGIEKLLPEYDAGDGTHLNYAGHRVLARAIFNRVAWDAD